MDREPLSMSPARLRASAKYRVIFQKREGWNLVNRKEIPKASKIPSELPF